MNELSVIALIRHGDYHQPSGVPSALLPYRLTDLGFQQARDAVTSCVVYAEQHGLTIDPVLDSSMQLRAWQTASLMAESLSGELSQIAGSFGVQEFSNLSERSVGAVANLTVSAIETLLADDPRYSTPQPGWKSNSQYCLPFQGAESLLVAGKRVADHVQWRAEQLDEPRLKILVGHGAAIRHACVHLGLLDLDSVSTISMHHARPVFISKEITGWRMAGGTWKQRTASSEGDEIREG
ncbi:MAG: broad specificity phosphatase PhoE [Candidatus Azotimanducaceae bacterium]|jgi:broad specificity phosphatase PhoE